jgi:hypothetical protein
VFGSSWEGRIARSWSPWPKTATGHSAESRRATDKLAGKGEAWGKGAASRGSITASATPPSQPETIAVRMALEAAAADGCIRWGLRQTRPATRQRVRARRSACRRAVGVFCVTGRTVRGCWSMIRVPSAEHAGESLKQIR